MFYLTYNQPENYSQMSFEDMMLGRIPAVSFQRYSPTSTRTRIVHHTDPSYRLAATRTPVEQMINNIKLFNSINYNKFKKQIEEYESIPKENRLFNRDIQREYESISLFADDVRRVEQARKAHAEETGRLANKCYTTFLMRKKSNPRKFRTINAPSEDLSKALRNLKELLDSMMIRSHHASAFAYIEHRSIVDAVKKHQKWESHWYSHFDFSDFFGSTTLDFLLSQMEMIYPFHFILQNPEGKAELTKALQLCFLDGGLPQGTPISPWITNMMMIPFDHIVTNTLTEFQFPNTDRTERFVYTRYADDIIVSSRGTFNVKEIENFIQNTLFSMNAPFALNPEKTHYGSRAGANWNLGLMVNKDNEITVGHKKKKELEAMLTNYILDRANGNPWDLDDIYALQGKIAYFRSIEAAKIERLIQQYNKKFNTDVLSTIKQDIKSYKI